MSIQSVASREWRKMRREFRERDFDEAAQIAARLAYHERAAASMPPPAPARKLMARPFVTMTAAEIAAEVERAIAVARARGVIR